MTRETKYYQLHMLVRVLDRRALLRTANKHMAALTGEKHSITDPSEALIALIDPGGGGSAYTGNLITAGVSIEDTSCNSGAL